MGLAALVHAARAAQLELDRDANRLKVKYSFTFIYSILLSINCSVTMTKSTPGVGGGKDDTLGPGKQTFIDIDRESANFSNTAGQAHGAHKKTVVAVLDKVDTVVATPLS